MFTDFEFNGKNLSDFGFVTCNFGSKGLETIGGVKTTFNTVPVQNGVNNLLTSVQYDECLTTQIQICKNPCHSNDMEISPTLFRELSRWLCRQQFLKFKLLSEEHIDTYHEVVIQLDKIELDGKLVGLELNVTSNRPFSLKEPVYFTIKNTVQNGKHSIYDVSHEEGYIYPYMEVTVLEDGNLSIYNEIENRETVVKNCVAGEVITMDYPMISSNDLMHKIQDDFNWEFFRIANTY